jgi:uncharacterized protein YjbI with pentapeptide repeats
MMPMVNKPNNGLLELFLRGANDWNSWRSSHLSDAVSIDFAGVKEELNFEGMNLLNTGMENLQTAHIVGRPLDLTRAVFLNCKIEDVTWSGLSLQYSLLFDCKFSGCDFSLVNAKGSDWGDCRWENCDFSGACLLESDLSYVSFVECDFRNAKLISSDLHCSEMIGCWVLGADFDLVTFSETALCGLIGLSESQNLGTTDHTGPSSIDIQSLTPSANIPLSFLRGVGLSETIIDYLPSLTGGAAIEYYPTFISYSSKDKEFAERLHADLQNKGVRCWYAPEDMKIGDRERKTIHEAIRLHDKLLLILSENSVQSAWVESEVERAMKKERETGQDVLFPVRLDNSNKDVKSGWVNDVETRHIGDFRKWKEHDEYQKAFDRLLRDLKKSMSVKQPQP